MSSSPGKPPIWSIFVVQAVSVIGDQIGQRASRYDFAHSSRRMLMALTFVSGTQILLILGILQGALPASISGAIYSQGGTLPCYEEVDMDGKLPGYCDNPAHHCHQIDCPSQGPGSMGRSIGLHPLLLLNGFINVAYYIGEVMLYHHPLGLVFIVIAALSATFVIDPMEGAMGLSASSPVPTAVIVLGIVGSVFCVIESKVGADKSLKGLYKYTFAKLQHCLCYAHFYVGRFFGCAVSAPREPMPVYEAPEESSPEITRSPSVRKEHTAPLLVPAPLPFPADDTADDSPSPDSGRGWVKRDPIDDADHEKGPLVQHDPTSDEQDLDPNSKRPTWMAHVKSSLAVFIPFIMLSATYGLWFVTQKVFNDDYRTNMFGYTSIDQVLAPIYMWVFLLIVDLVPPFRRAMHSKEDQRESWFSALKGAFETLFLKHKGRAFFTVFTYRLLINARAVAYFYMGVNYDLTAVFLELQLVRVVLSWILAVVVCAVAPGFIGLSKAERNTVFAPLNMFFKLVGSAFVLAAIFIFNDSQN